MTLVPSTTSSTGSSGTSFDVVLVDGSHEVVTGADAYQQEASMTTFFRNDGGRQAVGSWSVRVASFRTDHVVMIRRQEAASAEVRHLHPA